MTGPSAGIDLDRLHEGLEEYGGFCDCEVVLDVDADEVFTPVRTPRGRPMGRGLSEPRPAGADLAHTVSPAPPPAGGTDTGSPRNSGVADQGRSDAGRCDDAAVEPAVVERTENTIVVTSVIPAPPSALFAVLADPAEHARIDGSGTVTATADGGGPAPLTAVGQVFTMAMHQDRPGPEDYRTDNHVVELVPERLITWTTARAGQPPPGVRWSWQLEPVEGGTRVRHVYDWSQVHDPAVLARVSFPRVAPEQLVGTMQRLAALVTDRTTG